MRNAFASQRWRSNAKSVPGQSSCNGTRVACRSVPMHRPMEGAVLVADAGRGRKLRRAASPRQCTPPADRHSRATARLLLRCHGLPWDARHTTREMLPHRLMASGRRRPKYNRFNKRSKRGGRQPCPPCLLRRSTRHRSLHSTRPRSRPSPAAEEEASTLRPRPLTPTAMAWGAARGRKD